MHVTNIEVRFSRRVQAAQYEPVESECKLVATLEEGDDADSAALDLMIKAKATVTAAFKTSTIPSTAPVPPSPKKVEKKVVAEKEPAKEEDTEEDLGEPRAAEINPFDVDSEPDMEPATEEVTHDQLLTMVQQAIQNKKVTKNVVSEMMASVGAPRIRDIKDPAAFAAKLREKSGG